MKQKNEKINKQVFKKNEEELQQYLMFMYLNLTMVQLMQDSQFQTD